LRPPRRRFTRACADPLPLTLAERLAIWSVLVCIMLVSVRLVRFQIHCESETFQILSRNDSRSNQNHFVKSFDLFVKTFQIQWKWEGSESESLETPILPFYGSNTKTWNVSNRFTSETFWFSPFGTAPSDSSLNLKRFTLPNGTLVRAHMSVITFQCGINHRELGIIRLVLILFFAFCSLKILCCPV
jgi:hypothetical protein